MTDIFLKFLSLYTLHVLQNNIFLPRAVFGLWGKVPVLHVPWTPQIFMEFYCVSSQKPIMSEKTKPQTVVVSCRFWFVAAQWEMSKSIQGVHVSWIHTVICSICSSSSCFSCVFISICDRVWSFGPRIGSAEFLPWRAWELEWLPSLQNERSVGKYAEDKRGGMFTDQPG